MLVLVVASSLATSCKIEASASGRPCATDDACGAGHFCRIEVEPAICLPGALGLPGLPNFPPFIERAIVIVPIGIGNGDGGGPVQLEHSGVFEARDPEGDDVTFTIDAADRTGPLGTLDVLPNGEWTFTLAEPVPAADGIATHRLQAIDVPFGNVGTANVLVVVVTQPPSEFLRYWVGAGGADSPTSITDAASWNPAGAPDADQSVAVGPAALGALDIDVDSEVFGWLSTATMPITMDATTVTVRGTRILSDSKFDPAEGGRFVAAPVGNFDFEVQLGGLMPSLELQGPARAIGNVHVIGDLALADGGGAVRLEADLSVDGDVTQAPNGPAILMQGGAFRTGGDLILTGDAKSVITAGLLDVGGALDAPTANFGGANLLVRFSNNALRVDGIRDPVATVRLPDNARIGNAHVAKDAAVVFTTPLIVEGTLQISGGVRVEAPLVVETLVLRPSFADLGDDEGRGSITARACFIAPYLARPSWLTCDDEDIAPPLDRPDGGVDVEPPPDPGPPSVCTRLNADVETSTGIAGIASDNMEHGLVVVNAGGDPVSDRFVFDGLSLDAIASTAVRGGEIDLFPDGSFTFTPNSIPGIEGLDIAIEVGIRNDDGTPLVAGNQEACVDVHIIDTTGMNVMIGFSWDDPAAWTFGRIPTEADRVFIPASLRARVASETGAALVARELYVSSGAVLYTGSREMRIADVVLVGGTLDARVVIGPPTRETSAVGGRIASIASANLGASSAALVCGGGKTRLAADVDTATLDSDAPCNFVVGQNRLTVRGDVVLADALGLRMNDDAGAVVFQGDLTASALGGVDSFLNRGELQFRGLINLGGWLTPASRSHHTFIFAEGDIELGAIEYGGFLTVNADSEGSLSIDGGHVGRLFALRDVQLGAELFVDELQMTPAFATSTDPALFRVTECLPQPQHPACLNPP